MVQNNCLFYTKTPINANPMIAKRHFKKTNKCKNAMPFGKKNRKRHPKSIKKTVVLLKIKRFWMAQIIL
jgi:hypothetical protein